MIRDAHDPTRDRGEVIEHERFRSAEGLGRESDAFLRRVVIRHGRYACPEVVAELARRERLDA